MLTISPANEPLIFAALELTILWFACMGCGNAYYAWAHANELMSWSQTQVPPFAFVVFHLVCALIFLAAITALLPKLRPRSDALPFMRAVKLGVRSFKSQHSGVVGVILTLPATWLPTCAQCTLV
jgi:hypothetical protein